MPSGASQRDKLLEIVLQAHREEYRELGDDWKALDGKSQGSVAIAGIFLAAIFAFIRQLTDETPHVELLLLAVTVFALLAAVWFAIAALWVREVTSSPLGTQLAEVVQYLLAAPDLESNPDRASNFLGDHIRMWRETNEDVRAANGRKASHLQRSQMLLGISVGTVAILTILRIV